MRGVPTNAEGFSVDVVGGGVLLPLIQRLMLLGQHSQKSHDA